MAIRMPLHCHCNPMSNLTSIGVHLQQFGAEHIRHAAVHARLVLVAQPRVPLRDGERPRLLIPRPFRAALASRVGSADVAEDVPAALFHVRCVSAVPRQKPCAESAAVNGRIGWDVGGIVVQQAAQHRVAGEHLVEPNEYADPSILAADARHVRGRELTEALLGV